MNASIYVADTHALVWYLFNPKRLSLTARQIFNQVDNDNAALIIPVVVIAEAAMVIERGRITASLPQLEQILKQMQDSRNYHLSELTLEIVQTAIRFQQISGIFDRLIVAEAYLLKANLITRDEEIQKAAVVPTIW